MLRTDEESGLNENKAGRQREYTCKSFTPEKTTQKYE